MIDPVGSNARCGSAVFSVNELSTTSVGAAVPCTDAPSAAAANASAPTPASSRCHFDLRTSECLTLFLLLRNDVGATPAADPIHGRAPRQVPRPASPAAPEGHPPDGASRPRDGPRRSRGG